MSKFHKLRITKIKRETVAAVSITFDIPKELKQSFHFTAGQYVTLKIIIDGHEIRRAYSICSSTNKDKITVAIKAIKNGTFSVFATKNLIIGQEIEVAEPEGKFCLATNEDNAKNYIAFAAGSGITPIMSMIKSVLENEPKSKFVLVYGNKSTFETIFFDELNELLDRYNNSFFIQYVYSKEQPKNALFGRIDTANINYVVNKYKNLNFSDLFICGPETMIDTVKETLSAKNYPNKNIHFELFTPSESKAENTLNLDGNSKITILLDDQETTFTMSQKSTVLEAVLKEKLEAPYSCQGGICSSCLAKVTKGNAVMDKNTILSEEEIAEGLILTCQAHPTTNEIVIDYDNI
ncbi:MAG: ferredoxin--NADP reductase [Flavobacteriaceae bacterium]|nr:ferredoxin--NADP reductase [Flavobacteriaceae bacterium]